LSGGQGRARHGSRAGGVNLFKDINRSVGAVIGMKVCDKFSGGMANPHASESWSRMSVTLTESFGLRESGL